MKKVIGIVGSPRISGNTELLVIETLKVCQNEGLDTTLITLHDKEIAPCDGCRVCRNTGECRIKDDFQDIIKEMLAADGIIIGSPVYVASIPSGLKALIDRATYRSWAGRPFENKVGGAVVVAGRGGHVFAFSQLLCFFFVMGMIIPGTTYWPIAFGRDKGEVSNDDKGLETSRNLGKKIAWLLKRL